MSERIDKEVTEMLMPREEVVYVASQSKTAPGGSFSTQNKIYITNNRILFKDPKWMGLKANIIDISYKDISAVILKRGIFTTEIHIQPRFSSKKIRLPAVDKKIALQASMLIQQGMRGELVSLHEHKSKEPSDQHQLEAFTKLEKLVDMSQKGLLTDQEFTIMKEELMLNIRLKVNGNRPENAASEVAERYNSHKQEVQVFGQTEHTSSCRYCNFTALPIGSKFCPECGHGIIENTNVWKMCPACDVLGPNDSVFCTSCKQKFPETLS